MIATDDKTVTRSEFEALQQQIEELKAQVASLLAASKGPAVPKISDDTIAVIAAAVAAYVGKKATIKFVRTVSDESGAWQTYGRANISGSHALPRTRGW
jgi:methylmalonyl-CoA carboxyltransferase large subunit